MGRENVAGDDAASMEATSENGGQRMISGLFSTQNVEKVGTGTTSRKTISKMYWYAIERPDGETVEVQPLNKHNIPSGPKTEVPKEDFLERFSPEPEYYQKEVYPCMRELDATLERAEQQRKDGALYSAQFEYEQALDIDEDNVRANFGLGLTYMERGDTNRANDIFKRLVTLDAAFSPEHKHLFNEFGINLRKSKLYDQAVDYYTRAVEMTDSDENLHYNMARAFFEKGQAEECKDQLQQALLINPDHEEAAKFLDFIEKRMEAAQGA
ncbi:tetratricopeptide repeat protein [Desulfovibrio oxyclinae]|uniref:tetratricopeptide repeat protein n=1 Tax=Desulfovibrio oxyclinae TaxID=63560 RepID=UPI00037E6AA5